MRPVWKGAVSFGLVYVPVKMFTATEKKDVKFNYLHVKCNTPIQYRRYCSACDQDVPMEEIVRGYQYEKGRYVVLREGDLEVLPPGGPHNVEILDFVDLARIDPVYYDKAYYLAPAAGGEKVYALLKRAMQETGKAAVARVAIRSKVSLAVLRAAGETLSMSTMFYPDEVRDAGAIEEVHYQVELSENEIKMAVSLIERLSAPFEPQKYTDTRRQALMDLIQARVAGEAMVAPAAPEAAKVVDLMEALKASIDLAQSKRDAAGAQAGEKGGRPARRKKSGNEATVTGNPGRRRKSS
ncbi:Ku protein [Desulfotomaculum copahuensis]|uniref:Non-homologous end joining protein Ku n=1 Tax=Desulfotomaculum copahuensis TaxID=1838280 RepID=A0A1B7LFS9_9FIRM|nr:Ku protein [Desulfotomaculum copahuensis]OAT83578.1 Ku protein [Desulfotomaculum copahuensis]